MKLALLSLFLSIPGLAQVGIVLEPMGAYDAEILLGLSKHTVWTVYVSAPPGTQFVSRQEVTAATPISELTYQASLDLLGKAMEVSKPRLLGGALKLIARLGGDASTAYGFVDGSMPFIAVGGGLKLIGMLADLSSKVEPNAAAYTPQLLPADRIPCDAGKCGGWYIVTEKLDKPVRVETIAKPIVGVEHDASLLGRASLVADLPRYTVEQTRVNQNPLPSWAQQSKEYHAIAAVSTHPQIEDPEETYALRIAALIREHTATIGAQQ